MLKKFNFKMFFTILITLLLPSIYKTLSIYFIGDIKDANSYSISSQLLWVNLLYEVLQEFLILPIYFVLSVKNNDISDKKNELRNKVITGSIFVISLYLFFAILVIIFANDLCKIMSVNESIINDTVIYVRFETIAYLFVMIYKYFFVFLIILNKKIMIILASIFEVALYVVFNIFFISNFGVSLKTGVIGITYVNIIVNLIMTLLVFILLSFYLKIFTKNKISFKWIKTWIKEGSWTGLDSFVRNFVFMFVVVKIANSFENSGVYWIINNFVWQWLLLPSLALNELIKSELSENNVDFMSKTKTYFIFAIFLCLFWLLTIPGWDLFIINVMNYKESKIITYIALIQTPFYISFIFNNIMDSAFYARGKSWYIFVQSIIINIVCYSIVFVLYKTNVIYMNLTNLSLIFGICMSIDFIPTVIQYTIFIKKKKFIKKEEIYV